MADIFAKSRIARARPASVVADAGPPRLPLADTEMQLRLIELLFFAYRDFTGEPDAALAGFGLGRAHHRVLHFVARHPGLRVADLLDVLKITKQSLARVLKQLVDEGFVEQHPGPADRRERLLTLTATGHALAGSLAELQTTRIAAALAGMPAEAVTHIERFLFAIISPGEREQVARMLADAARRAGLKDGQTGKASV